MNYRRRNVTRPARKCVRVGEEIQVVFYDIILHILVRGIYMMYIIFRSEYDIASGRTGAFSRDSASTLHILEG